MSKSRAESMFGDTVAHALLEGVRDAQLGVAVLRASRTGVKTLYANRAARSMLGYAGTEELREDWLDLGGLSELTRPRMDVAALHKAGHRVVLDLIRVDRAPDDGDSPEAPRATTTLFFSEVKPREVGLETLDYEARFRSLIEGAPDGVAITRAGTLLYVNPAAAKLLGYDHPEELVGTRITEFLDDEGRKRFADRAGVAGLPPLEYRTQRRDKSWIVAEITSLPTEWEGGRAVIAFARDVTERAKMTEQLKRADRLASLGTLSAGVAHEINNPLTFMTLGIELLAKRLNAASLEEGERGGMLSTLAELRRGAERVAEIVRDLRTFSRGDDQGAEPVDVRSVVESAHRMVDHRARHLATVTMDVPDLPVVRANASRLEQVFVNLLLNACQAFDEGDAANRIEIRGGRLEGARIFIDIVDNGPGISADVLPRIFDPFFTTKTVGEGTGLGLAICHGIVAACGGVMSVESAPGRTMFRVVLPSMAEARGDGGAETDLHQPGPRLQILIVDDEPAIVRSLKRSLAYRHEVVTAGTAEEALAAIEATEFDVVLCDLAMPGFSGIDLYHRLLAENPRVAARFAVMTGGAVSPRARTFLESWHGPRIDKPFSLRKLEKLLLEATGMVVAGQSPSSEPPSSS